MNEKIEVCCPDCGEKKDAGEPWWSHLPEIKEDEVIAGKGEDGSYKVRKLYGKDFKLMQFVPVIKPKGLKQWLWMLWGLDIFLWQVPVLKPIVGAIIMLYYVVLR